MIRQFGCKADRSTNLFYILGVLERCAARADSRSDDNIQIQIDATVSPEREVPHDVRHMAPGPTAGLEYAPGVPLLQRRVLQVLVRPDSAHLDISIAAQQLLD